MIYTVTTYTEKPRRIRTIGYFMDFTDARSVIIDNFHDMAENGYYEYAIIEKVREGLYPFGSDSWWFVYDPKVRTYIPTEKPAKFASSYNFSIG